MAARNVNGINQGYEYMTALSWQAIIALTIIGAFLIGYIFFQFNRALQIGLGVVFFWIAWTIGLSSLFVGYSLSGPLAEFQLFLIIVIGLSGLALIYSFRRWNQRYDHLLTENRALGVEIKELQSSFNAPAVSENLKPSRVIQGTSEHRKELIRQIQSANRRIIILSGWVTEYGFDSSVRKAIQKAARKKVKIYIGWGYKSKSEVAKQYTHMTDAERDLITLGSKYKDNVFLTHFQNHSKLLIVDSTCIIGSFNWLSNAFSQNDELSVVIDTAYFVDQLWVSVSQKLEYYGNVTNV